MINDFKYKFCINLDRRADKWEETKKEFKKNNITNVKRISAVDGNTIENSDLKVKKGVYALGLTLIKLISEAKDKNYKQILIFEDDVEFVGNFNELSEGYLNEIFERYKNWSMIYFGVNNIEAPIKLENNITRLKKAYTSHCMVIKSDIYDLILDRFEKEGKIKEIDVIYSDLHKKIEAYSTSPALCIQRESFSDIENKVVKKYVR